MLKKRLVKLLVTVALLAAIVGGSGVVADSLGLSGVSPAHACQEAGTSGGGC